MKIEEICEYLNELGILDIKHTSLFLSIYSNFIMNNNNKFQQSQYSEDNTMKIILFAFLKKIISNDKELYEVSSNIISSYNKNKIVRLYQGICFFNKLIFYQIKNRFNHFLFLLFKKKYPKRKYFPYDPSQATKINSKSNDDRYQRSFNNTNRRTNNNFNNFEDYSMSYISMRNNSKSHPHNLILNTGENNYSHPEIDFKEYKLGQSYKKEIPRGYRKNTPKKKKFIDDLEKMRIKKNEISLNNMKKKIYDAQTRINNYENIMPTSFKNRQREIKSKEEENYYTKLKEDQLYNKLTEKEIDPHNILDRLYRREIIKKFDDKRKEKENKIRPKSPINWDKVNIENSRKKYLNLNMNSHDMNSLREIFNKPKKNANKKGSFSFKNSIDSKDNNENDLEENYEENINNNIYNNNEQYLDNNINYNYKEMPFNNNDQEKNKLKTEINKLKNEINKNANNNNFENLDINFKNTNINNQNNIPQKENNENMNNNLIKEDAKNILREKIDANKNKNQVPEQQLFSNNSFGNIKQSKDNNLDNNINNEQNQNNKNIQDNKIDDKENKNEYYDFPQKYDSNSKKNKINYEIQSQNVQNINAINNNNNENINNDINENLNYNNMNEEELYKYIYEQGNNNNINIPINEINNNFNKNEENENDEDDEEELDINNLCQNQEGQENDNEEGIYEEELYNNHPNNINQMNNNYNEKMNNNGNFQEVYNNGEDYENNYYQENQTDNEEMVEEEEIMNNDNNYENQENIEEEEYINENNNENMEGNNINEEEQNNEQMGN